MRQLSPERLIAGIAIFVLSVYFVTQFPDKVPYLIAVIVILLLVKYAIQWYSNKNSDNNTQLDKNTSSDREAELYKVLLKKSQGDRQQVERLIDYERRRSPDASRVELLQSAIDRWERDLR